MNAVIFDYYIMTALVLLQPSIHIVFSFDKLSQKHHSVTHKLYCFNYQQFALQFLVGGQTAQKNLPLQSLFTEISGAAEFWLGKIFFC